MFKLTKSIVLWGLYLELTIARKRLDLYHRKESALIASESVNRKLLGLVRVQISRLNLKIAAIETKIDQLR